MPHTCPSVASWRNQYAHEIDSRDRPDFPAVSKWQVYIAFEHFHLYRLAKKIWALDVETETRGERFSVREELRCMLSWDDVTMSLNAHLCRLLLWQTQLSQIKSLSPFELIFPTLVARRFKFSSGNMQHDTNATRFLSSMHSALAEKTREQSAPFIKQLWIYCAERKTSPKEEKRKLKMHSRRPRCCSIQFVAQSKSWCINKNTSALVGCFSIHLQRSNLCWRTLWMSCSLTLYEMFKIYLVFC